MDKVNEYLKRNYHSRVYDGVVEIPQITKHIECNDGFVISVQASDVHCCEPRRIKAWPYSEVELGFPSELWTSLSLIMRINPIQQKQCLRMFQLILLISW